MTGQREGFLGDILDKVKDLVTDDEKTDPRKQEDPPLETQCCGKPPIQPVHGGRVVTEGPFEHDPNCPKHPGNVVQQEVAS